MHITSPLSSAARDGPRAGREQQGPAPDHPWHRPCRVVGHRPDVGLAAAVRKTVMYRLGSDLVPCPLPFCIPNSSIYTPTKPNSNTPQPNQTNKPALPTSPGPGSFTTTLSKSPSRRRGTSCRGPRAWRRATGCGAFLNGGGEGWMLCWFVCACVCVCEYVRIYR